MRSEQGFIIMSNNVYKIVWDLSILFLVLLICIIVPIRLAFVEEDTHSWKITWYVVDGLFFIDIVLTFFTSVTDEMGITDITNKKVIAIKYMKSWFIIDLFSVLPIDVFFAATMDFNTLVRFTKIGKLYKLIRMTRLTKVLKIIKSKNTVVSHFAEKMKVNSGVERMIFFIVFFLFFMHIFSCFYIFLAQLDPDYNTWLRQSYHDWDDIDLYIKVCYFIVTTISTVGYGDMVANTQTERIFCIIVMFSGVTVFTFISGALSSILSNYD